MPARAPVERFQVAISDAAEARAFLDGAYGARLKVRMPGDGQWTVTLEQREAGGVTLADLTVPAEITYQVDGRDDDVIFATVLKGTAEVERDQVVERYAPGDAYLGIDRSGYLSRSTQVRMLTVGLAATHLAEVAANDPDGPAAPVRFLSRRPVSAGAAARWSAAGRLVHDLLGGAEGETSPLALGAATRMLTALTLATFPNTAGTEPTPDDRHDAHPPTVRRAVAFLETHPDLDLTVVDIARAAFVTPRALQLAFRRHLGTTPLHYLRRVRLDRAHADLLAADPDVDTVTGIAARWGWVSPSRFAADYLAAYGRHPHQTLRS